MLITEAYRLFIYSKVIYLSLIVLKNRYLLVVTDNSDILSGVMEKLN